MSTPSKPLIATPLPESWRTLTNEQKLAWLDTQPQPEDPTVSLGDVYRRAEMFNAILHVAADTLGLLQAQFVRSPGNDKGKLALKSLIEAFNTLITTFGNAQYVDYMHLLADGRIGKQLPPLKTGMFKPITPDAAPVSVIEITQNALAVLLSGSPGLGSAQPGLGGASYADIIEAVVAAAQTFVKAWNNGEQSANAVNSVTATSLVVTEVPPVIDMPPALTRV